MASKCQIVKSKKTPKFSSRQVRRCEITGRARGVYRKYGICRICFRAMAHRGEIPGVQKASW